MAYQPMADSAVFKQTADLIVSNTAAETSALGAGLGSRMIRADQMKVGTRVRVHGAGIYSIPLGLTTSLTIKVKLGSVVVAQVTTTGLLLGATNKSFYVDVNIHFRSLGAAGKVIAEGCVEYASGLGSHIFDDLDNAGAESTVDTTTDQMVDVTVQWNTASTTRILKTTAATIMVL